MDTDREVGIVGVGDLTHTKGHKRKMEDAESADTWTNKKNKVKFFDKKIASLTIYIFIKGTDFCIKFQVGKKRSTVKITVKIDHQ